MSEPLPPAENEEDTGNIARREKKPKYEWQNHLRVNPVALFELLCREINAYTSSKQKRDNYTALLRTYLLPVVFAMAAIILTGAVLYQIGFFESERVIAAFTVVLALVGIVQWVVSHQQWQAVQAQNEILAAQNDQTNAMIEEMRLDQRAWLCIEEVQITGLLGNSNVKCIVKVSNTGKTLGKIIAGTVTPYDTPLDFDEEEIKRKFESQGFEKQFEYLVVPGRPVNLQTITLGIASINFANAVHARQTLYHVLCRFQYLDITGKPYEIKGFYTFEPPGPGVFTRANYCCFP